MSGFVNNFFPQMQQIGPVGASGAYVPYGDDRSMAVWFFPKAVQMGAASEEAGRPIFEDRHFVHIQQPGERDFVEREATGSDKMRWPEKWAAYEQQRDQAETGTPLQVLFPAEPSIIETLKLLRVQTVEQLAGLGEPAMARIGMGARGYVERARRFMEESKLAAPFSKMQGELEAERARTEALSTQLQQALARIDALEAADGAPRRRLTLQHEEAPPPPLGENPRNAGRR